LLKADFLLFDRSVYNIHPDMCLSSTLYPLQVGGWWC